jgi:hypothetical protein
MELAPVPLGERREGALVATDRLNNHLVRSRRHPITMTERRLRYSFEAVRSTSCSTHVLPSGSAKSANDE